MLAVPTEGEENQEENTAFARYMEDAMFLIPTPQVLQKIITGLEDLYEHDIADLDMQGDLYEYMLGKLSTAGRNGQFRTVCSSALPRPISLFERSWWKTISCRL